jgi:hypothetical protein
MANFTEYTIKLPDGIELLYTDSGAPDTASYTTLIVLHGSAFNGGTLDTRQTPIGCEFRLQMEWFASMNTPTITICV